MSGVEDLGWFCAVCDKKIDDLYDEWVMLEDIELTAIADERGILVEEVPSGDAHRRCLSF